MTLGCLASDGALVIMTFFSHLGMTLGCLARGRAMA